MAKPDERARNWAFVAYPDSLPDTWREIIAGWHVKAFVSPLHDSDVNPDGTAKKPHYHVVVICSGKKSESQIQALSDELNATKVQRVKDTRAYARYLCHLDNPEKAQYPVNEVQAFGGADYLAYTAGAADVDEAVGEMMDWLNEQGITSFAALSRYARAYRPDWFRVLTSKRTVFIAQYCRSLEWEADPTKHQHSVHE